MDDAAALKTARAAREQLRNGDGFLIRYMPRPALAPDKEKAMRAALDDGLSLGDFRAMLEKQDISKA